MQLIRKVHKSSEDCAHKRDDVEYWLARGLQKDIDDDPTAAPALNPFQNRATAS